MPESGITVRIDEDIVEVLKTQAARSGLSFNALANRIFRAYVEWDLFAIEAGWVVLQRPVLRRLFDALDEGTLKAIAEAAARESSEIRILMVGEDTLAAYYKVLRGRLRKSGFAFTEATDGRVRRFTIRHDMGRKWSYFFKHHYEAMIAGVGYPSRVSFTDDTLVIEVDESRAGFDSNNNDGLRL